MGFVMLGQSEAPLQVSQDMMPYRSAPVYLRLVDTTKEALNYASAGFHVSATRSQAGGCSDKASAIKGTDPKAMCAIPLNREDLRALWANAANGYLTAAQAPSLQDKVAMLRQANSLADVAYGQEGVAPPRDPALVQAMPEANYAEPVTKSSRKLAATLGILGALATLGVGYAVYRGQHKHAAYYGY